MKSRHHRFVADFIGDANIVDAAIEQVENGRASVELGGLRLGLPSRGLTPGPALLAVRPRAVQLSAAPHSAGIEVVIAKSAYLGSHMEYEVEGPMGALFVIDSMVDRPLEPDSKAWLTLARHGVTLIADR